MVGRWGAVIISIIKKTVEELIKKYSTNDPFVIAKSKKIHVIEKPLHESVKGMYQYVDRNKFIYINENLPEHLKKIVCGHELGHAILHGKTNCIFLRNHTFYSPDRLEREANIFAAYLFLNDNILRQYEGYTIEQISCAIGVPVQYIKLLQK